MYPLRFQPLFRRYLWGGRRLETLLNKPLGDGQDYAESWEIVDHGDDQSIVSAGPLAGRTLGELVREHPHAMLGTSMAEPRFPLLLKFLDAHRNLSVQVHPDDTQAARLDPPDLGKTEAWYVIHADPGSVIYAGLKRGFDRRAFEREVRCGTTELCLHRFEPQAGDCLFIPAGTVHALGSGLVVAEIQQASDTTFRLFDWNRVGPDGRPRPLHSEEALDTIDFSRGPVTPQVPEATDDPRCRQLVACDKFILRHWKTETPIVFDPIERFRILVVLEGSCRVEGDPSDQHVERGQSLLLPADLPATKVSPQRESVLLEAFVP